MHNEAGKFLPTRHSLLSKLRNWDDQDSWREFFETYWRLIYGVARKAGLEDGEAQDVVQETVLSVAKQMPSFKYDRAQGSFKAWLRHITRCRIADALRKRHRASTTSNSEPAEGFREFPVEEIADPRGQSLEVVWDQEWEEHLRTSALAKLKQRVKLEHYQIFELHVLQNWPVKEVVTTFGMATPTIYWISHRLTRMLRKLVRELESDAL